MPGAFDDAGVGAVPPLGIEVAPAGDVGLDGGAGFIGVLRGKGRRGDGPAGDADGPDELDPVGVDVGLGGGLADQGADRVVELH